MSDLRTFATELESSVIAPAFESLVERRRRRVRNRIVGAGVASVVAVAVAVGTFSASTRNRADSVPATTPIVAPVDWFVVQGPFGLETISTDGRARAVVRDKLDHDPNQPTWSRVTDRLAWIQFDEDNTLDLWVGDSEGQNGRLLHDCVAPCVWSATPAISPDGKLVAFIKGPAGDQSALLVVDLAGTVVAQLDLGPAGAFIHPDWSPDGKRILGTWLTFGATPEEINARLATIEVGAMTAAGSAVQPTAVITASRPAFDAMWSPDGSMIAYSVVAPEPDATSGPDVLEVGPHADASDLWVARSDGTEQRQLTSAAEGEQLTSAVWSSDGRFIYALHSRPDGDTILARVDVATGRVVDVKDRIGNIVDAVNLDRG